MYKPGTVQTGGPAACYYCTVRPASICCKKLFSGGGGRIFGARGIKHMTFRNSVDAFNDAIAAGRLSANESARNYAGHYMYMGTDAKGIDLFKHINTRTYLA